MRLLPAALLTPIVAFMLAASASAAHQAKPPLPFTDDGCSCAPDGDFGECCRAHDRVYYQGGSKQERLEADRVLRDCIRRKGHTIADDIYYFGVRIGGVPWLPTPWRWGFGYPFKKGHRGYSQSDTE